MALQKQSRDFQSIIVQKYLPLSCSCPQKCFLLLSELIVMLTSACLNAFSHCDNGSVTMHVNMLMSACSPKNSFQQTLKWHKQCIDRLGTYWGLVQTTRKQRHWLPFLRKQINTPTGASTKPKNFDLNKNISTSTSDIALICLVTEALILRFLDLFCTHRLDFGSRLIPKHLSCILLL